MAIYYDCPVYITEGGLKGRIGYFDDESIDEEGEPFGFISLGNPLYASEYEIPMKFFREITTEDLYKRQKEILDQLMKSRYLKEEKISNKAKVDLLTEYIYIVSLFYEKYYKVRFLNEGNGKHLFISHSSKDNLFARLLATDLAEVGHLPWLDEWRIKAGESIPISISNALQKSDFVLVVISNNSNKSQWVQLEWVTKYWDEINEGKVKVIPLLIQTCTIPELLKTKKYVDFRNNYRDGLEELLFVLK